MTSEPSASPGRAGAAARTRIIDGAIACIARNGVADASMAAIAATGGVSKALLHYHYANRARLLTEVVTQLAHRLVTRERAAMEVSGTSAVDALWTWVESELALGELRALLELAMMRDPQVRAASHTAVHRRRRAAARTVEQLFTRLGLTARLPAPLIGSASVAFIDGLALDSVSPSDEPRVSFDVFWLALLSLAE